MNINIEQLKKKIIYRSNYRGTKEMDKLLGSFTNKYIDELSPDDLVSLEKLLDLDDDNLYKFYNGLKTDFIFEENKINSMFKKFQYKVKVSGGETGIRTQERVAPLPVFKTGAFNRSAISPCASFYNYNYLIQL